MRQKMAVWAMAAALLASSVAMAGDAVRPAPATGLSAAGGVCPPDCPPCSGPCPDCCGSCE